MMATLLKTAFDDPINFNVKHPLQNKWTLWYDTAQKKSTAANWSDNLKSVITLDTVEDFWGVYNNISKANELSIGSNYHFFKQGIRPEWEDAQNTDGGRWVIMIPKTKHGELDDIWLNSLLACIGEAFEQDGEEICGVVVSARKAQDRIALWTKSISKEPCLRLGKKLREVWRIPQGQLIGFQSHKAASVKKSSYNQDMYSV